MKIELKLTKGPGTGPTYLEIDMSKNQYSKPQLYIPRVNGKPSVAPGDQWYVWFMWRNPDTGKMDMKFKFKKGINRYKTAKERKEVGKGLVKAYEIALERGWNPITKTASKTKTSRAALATLQQALEYAYSIKAKNNKKQSTLDGYRFHLDRFLEWAKMNGWLGADPARFGIEPFYEFLDYLRFEYVNKKTAEGLSGTSINNHKRSLSALFTTLKNERLIPYNFIKDIPAVDEDPVNNKAFTKDELIEIRKVLQEKDPYLIHFIQFLMYPLLRPLEVCRLKVKDLNTEKWFLSVETKTERLSTRRIIDKMKPTLEALQLRNKPGHYSVFTNKNVPAEWEVQKLKSKVDHFGKRFAVIKNELGFGREYGLYSFRHTAIMDLFHSMQQDGSGEYEIYPKLMQYTQHKSVEGLKKYLRNHSYVLPADHSDIYTIDF